MKDIEVGDDKFLTGSLRMEQRWTTQFKGGETEKQIQERRQQDKKTEADVDRIGDAQDTRFDGMNWLLNKT
jgi:hypothetical protein